MITRKMSRDEVNEVVEDGGNFTKVGLEVFAENFFEQGLQDLRKQRYRDEVEELLSNLEMNAREFGNEVCGAVLGKAVLLTYTRRQVVTDALSYLSRAAQKGIKGAAAELCLWYAARIRKNDLANFPNANVGLTDCYDPTPEFPRLTFPEDVSECRRRLVKWLGKACEEDFDAVRTTFGVLCESQNIIPADKAGALKILEGFTDGAESKSLLARAKELVESGLAANDNKQIAEGAKVIKELVAKTDSLDAWRYMLECHMRGIGPFKTNKFRRDAKAAIARLEGQ